MLHLSKNHSRLAPDFKHVYQNHIQKDKALRPQGVYVAFVDSLSFRLISGSIDSLIRS